MSDPVFAVVGHPNKGKSSLVAALAEDESVAIGPEPGTTVKARRYPMRVDGRTLYTLVDTPGFQRARAVLEWLEGEQASAAQRPAAVARFVDSHASDPRFAAECQLLAPITAGAGILYVVDGAAPYAPEYDAEMEILRWTGRPSIAVINPIGDAGHVQGWSQALAQYFRVVRVLDALQAPFEKRLQVLSAFGELAEEWREPMAEAVTALRAARSHALRESAHAIAAMLADALAMKVERHVPAEGDPQAVRPELEARYREALRRREQACRARVQSLYRHAQLQRREPELELLDEDLFAADTWLLFGLSRSDLAKAGAAAGALAGLGIDAAVAGGSLLLGAAVGALVGGAAGWLGVDALAEMRIERLPLGVRVARYGPSRNPNLPFVLLGRARVHHRLLSGRSHSRREPLDLSRQGALNPLESAQRDRLARAFERLRSASAGSARRAEAVDGLTAAIEQVLRGDQSG